MVGKKDRLTITWEELLAALMVLSMAMLLVFWMLNLGG